MITLARTHARAYDIIITVTKIRISAKTQLTLPVFFEKKDFSASVHRRWLPHSTLYRFTIQAELQQTFSEKLRHALRSETERTCASPDPIPPDAATTAAPIKAFWPGRDGKTGAFRPHFSAKTSLESYGNTPWNGQNTPCNRRGTPCNRRGTPWNGRQTANRRRTEACPPRPGATTAHSKSGFTPDNEASPTQERLSRQPVCPQQESIATSSHHTPQTNGKDARKQASALRGNRQATAAYNETQRMTPYGARTRVNF